MGPALHVLTGGDIGLPGGTWARGQRTSAMEIMYEQPTAFGRFGLAIDYYNDGYLGPFDEEHYLKLTSQLDYRDGYAIEVTHGWLQGSRCRLSFAFGPEAYFDTSATEYRWIYQDRHGVGLRGRAAELCRLGAGVSLELSANRSYEVSGFSSTAALIGLAYTPATSAAADAGDSASSYPGGQFLDLLAGRSQLDDFHTSYDEGFSTWLSYERYWDSVFSLDYSVVIEKVRSILERQTGAVQISAHAPLTHRLELFAGIGPGYGRTDDAASSVDSSRSLLLASLGLRYHFGSRVSAIIRYGRISVPKESVDSDLLLGGVSLALPE
jgi:hypothetical protein